ncbi:restriction endonuclease subunit S [Thermoleophilia bacterium SCSIO 60948]|nr:restriction endonuclease subunit S [Thermoleophilia bacterium SCSIO 60948]
MDESSIKRRQASRSDWIELPLGDVVTLQRGFDLPKRKRQSGPYPVVSSAGITGRHAEFKARPPGVVIGRYGSLGEVHLIRDPYWPLNTSLWVRDFKGNDERFIAYMLRTVAIDGSSASAVPGVNRNHLHRLRVRLPARSVQRRVAALLSAFDELIEINVRRIELLERLARSLYREWFVRFRFPGRRSDSTGAVPSHWQSVALREVASVNPLKVSKADLPEPVRYLDISSVGVGQLDDPTVMPAADAPGRARRLVCDGDTIWSTVRPNRRAHGLVHNPDPGTVVSTGLAVLSPRRVPSAYLYLCTDSPEFAGYLVSRATGAAYPAVRPRDFEQAQVLLPDEELLARFAASVDPLLRGASALLATNRQLAETRDLLVPRLVTGRIDISDIDLGVLEPEAA